MLVFYAIPWILSPNVFKKTDPWLPLFLFYSKVLALFLKRLPYDFKTHLDYYAAPKHL